MLRKLMHILFPFTISYLFFDFTELSLISYFTANQVYYANNVTTQVT